MKNHGIANLRSITVFLLLFLAAANSAAAQGNMVQIKVRSSSLPIIGYGLVLSSAGTAKQEASNIEKKPGGEYVVSFKVPADLLKPENFATALVVGDTGDIAYGEVKRMSEKMPEMNLYKPVPPCPVKGADDPFLAAQSGTLEHLVQVRNEKSQLLRKKISEMLTEEYLGKLNAMEQIFGLAPATPLSADLPALELNTRLSRLVAAYRNVEYHKRFLASPSPEAKNTP